MMFDWSLQVIFVTLPPIVMEVESRPTKSKETNIGATNFSTSMIMGGRVTLVGILRCFPTESGIQNGEMSHVGSSGIPLDIDGLNMGFQRDWVFNVKRDGRVKRQSRLSFHVL